MSEARGELEGDVGREEHPPRGTGEAGEFGRHPGLGVLAQRRASGSFARGALPAKVPMLLLRADPLRVLSRSLPWCCIVFDACSVWRKVDPHQLEANGVYSLEI